MIPRACRVFLYLFLSLAAGAAAAQDTLRAAAVVNDEIISMLDVDMRIRLAILSIGQGDTPELRRRILPQVMRTLIDERLQSQEAERLDIKVSDKQVEAAIDTIAAQNNMSAAAFKDLMARRDVLVSALEDQVRAQLVWRTLVARRIRPEVQVTDEEVDEVVNRVASTRGSVQRRVSEIFLSVDSVLEEDAVRANAQRLFEELRKGANFVALARQFSESATAARGGDLGWVSPGQLPEEIEQVLARMKPGTIAPPIRSLRGFHIVLLREERQQAFGDISLNLKQVLFTLPEAASEDDRRAAVARATEVRNRIDGCDGLDELARAAGSPGSGDLGTVNLADLPEAIRAAVAGLPIGRPSEPLAIGTGIGVLVVCAREESGIDRERIREGLINQRIDLLSRRFMRDLRRAANVDIRI